LIVYVIYLHTAKSWNDVIRFPGKIFLKTRFARSIPPWIHGAFGVLWINLTPSLFRDSDISWTSFFI
jgi:hypothetical protein